MWPYIFKLIVSTCKCMIIGSHEKTIFPFVRNSETIFLFLKDFIYLILEKGERREKEKERNINVWLPLACPQPETRLTSQQVPRLGIEPATLCFSVQHSIHWDTPARAEIDKLSFKVAVPFCIPIICIPISNEWEFLWICNHASNW